MNPYTVLGLSFNASKEEINAAYRRLAKQCHPDLHPNDVGAAARFTSLNQAYKILLNEISGSQKSDLYSGIPTSPPTIVTIRRNVFMTVHEAITGGNKLIAGISGPCSACDSTGKIETSQPVECLACFGLGTTKSSKSYINAKIRCEQCSGTGKVSWFACHECAGYGTLHMENCNVDFPPGSRHGDQLIVPGGANNQAENIIGDVEITVVIKDPHFRISGNDIETSVSIEIWEATLGSTVDVSLPMGKSCRLILPAGTTSGARFRVRGRGLRYTEKLGDLVVTTKIRTPLQSEPGVLEAMTILKSSKLTVG